jgi:putative ABC transport system permease protein
VLGFRGKVQVMEESRDARGVAWIANFGQDGKYGVRLLARAPGFAAAAVLTVALGIGATTAMFSIVYGVLLQPLPFGEPDRLVSLWTSTPKRGLPRTYVGMANVYDWRARNHVFEAIAALRPIANFNLVGQGEPERLNGARVSANLFPVLRVSPLVGRVFTEDEDEIGRERVAILSYGLWQRRFGGDPAVAGRTISLSGVPYTVVGVMGPDFAYPSREYQIYVPLTFDPRELVNRQNYSYMAVARLKRGATLADARAEMAVISANLEREHPKENDGISTLVMPMLDDLVAPVRTPLYVLLGAVAAMLLVGCANLVNLLLARALVRQRELAVRAALGAGRARLVAQSIAEIVPMLALGGALGMAGAAWVVQGLVPLLPADVPRVENIGLQMPVFAVAFATLAAIAVIAGVWPALDALRGGLSASVGELSRGMTARPRRARMRDLLVVGQIAVTLWLAIGAALLTRSFSELRRIRPGFNPEHVYTAHLAVARSKYPKDTDVAEFYRRLLERVQSLPGVIAAGMVNRLPLSGLMQTGPIEFEGVDPAIGMLPNGDFRTVTPGYFRAMEIPLLRGRLFGDADTSAAPAVGLIDDYVAKTVFKGSDPIGRRFRIPVENQPWVTIVGVVGHVQPHRLDEELRAAVYWNYTQRTQDRMALAVRTHGNPEAEGPSIVAAIRALDSEQPVYDARTLEAVVDRSIAQRWLQTALLGSFAALALVLASIGVYGVMAYAVGQRRREFGIRMALGARRVEIVSLVMKRGALLFSVGVTGGVAAAAATARVLSTLLYDVSAFDPLSFVASTLVLCTAGLGACYLPARRAVRVDPSIALRAE